MAAQARRRPGSPDIEKLTVDPEAGLAGIPPKKAKKPGDFVAIPMPFMEDEERIIPRGINSQLLPEELRSAKVIQAKGRRRKTKKAKKVGRRKTVRRGGAMVSPQELFDLLPEFEDAITRFNQAIDLKIRPSEVLLNRYVDLVTRLRTRMRTIPTPWPPEEPGPLQDAVIAALGA